MGMKSVCGHLKCDSKVTFLADLAFLSKPQVSSFAVDAIDLDGLQLV